MAQRYPREGFLAFFGLFLMLIMDPLASALKEETLSNIKQLNDPIVVLFHDGESSGEEYTNALEVMKDLEKVRSICIYYCLHFYMIRYAMFVYLCCRE